MIEIKRNQLPSLLNPLTYLSLSLYHWLFYYPINYYLDEENNSITIKTGLVLKQSKMIELFRVKDIQVEEFIFGINKIKIFASGEVIELKNVKDHAKVSKELISMMREYRNNDNVKEII